MTTTNGTKSLESWIWSAACALRGAEDAPKYKDFILPLVFAKRLCDVFDDELDRIATEVGSREKALKLVKKDKKLVRFYVPMEPPRPADPVWSVIRTLSDHIGERLTTHLRAIADANPPLKGIIDRVDFNATTHGQRDIDDDRLSNLIEAISSKRLGLADVESDVIGRSYEFLIRKFAEGSGQSAGEFYTPAEVALVMARLMQLEPGMSVYDPCCGSAGLLIKCRAALDEQESRTRGSARRPLQLFGQEYVADTWAMANMNMIIHDLDGQIQIGDTFRKPAFRAGRGLQSFDRVVANPMWNQDWFRQKDYDNDEYSRFKFGTPPDSTADWGWVQHMLASVEKDGRVAVVLDTPAVSRGSGSKNKSREKEIRQNIVEAGLIDAVILLPENLFYNTGAPGIILILDKARSRKAAVRLVNASNLFIKGNPKNYLSGEHISTIVSAARSSKDIDDLCRVVTIEELRDIDYDLSPARHVPLDPHVAIVPMADAAAASETTTKALAEAHIATARSLASFLAVPARSTDDALPRGWRKVPLTELVASQLSGDWGEERPSESGIDEYTRCAVIRGTDFPDVAQLRFADVPVRYIRSTAVAKKRPQAGDVLIEISGGGKYQNTGRVVYLTEEMFAAANDPVMFTNFTKLLRIDSSTIHPRYFYYTWALLYDLGRTARYEKQPTNIKNFKLDDFLKHEFAIFPKDLNEQASVVAALDSIHRELTAFDNGRRGLLAVRHAALKELLHGLRQRPDRPRGQRKVT